MRRHIRMDTLVGAGGPEDLGASLPLITNVQQIDSPETKP